MKKINIYIGIILVSVIVFAQTPRPSDDQSESIAIMNGTVHIGNGLVINNSAILFEKGKIVGVSDATSSRPDLTGYKIIDASGKHVYPGFILPGSVAGLNEVDAIRATLDYREIGSITPNVRSQIAFNTDSELFPTFRHNGIILSQVVPQGGLVSGTSSIMNLDAWNWEDATYQKDDAVHISWPSKTYGPRWWMGETNRRENKEYDNQVESILQLIRDSRAYHLSPDRISNLKLESMKDVIDGNQSVFVNADRAREIIESITKLKSVGIDKIVLVGARDAWYVKDIIKDNNIPVLLNSVHRMPSRDEEDVDFPFRLPGLLNDFGILVGLQNGGSLMAARNLPFYAGTAAAYGVSKEDALKMITFNNAKILGIEKRTGTIEEGKEANIIITEGDVLDMKSSIVLKVFIQGRDVIIDGKQEVLYNRYKDKYSK